MGCGSLFSSLQYIASEANTGNAEHSEQPYKFSFHHSFVITSLQVSALGEATTLVIANKIRSTVKADITKSVLFFAKCCPSKTVPVKSECQVPKSKYQDVCQLPEKEAG